MEIRDFEAVAQAQGGGREVVFVEQLDLGFNQPPRRRTILVYSPVWGILSQHDDLAEACRAHALYAGTRLGFRPVPRAFIYQWQRRKWTLLEDAPLAPPAGRLGACAARKLAKTRPGRFSRREATALQELRIRQSTAARRARRF